MYLTHFSVSVCSVRASPRLLCTAAQQKSGQGSEEDQNAEQSAAEKVLAEEKGQLEEQLKEVTVSLVPGCSFHINQSINQSNGSNQLIYVNFNPALTWI